MVNIVRRPSRLIALSSSLLLAALVLVTSGFACDSAAKGSMSGMQMNGHPAAAAALSAGQSYPHHDSTVFALPIPVGA